MGIEVQENAEGRNRQFSVEGKLYEVMPKRWGILVIVSTILLLDTFSASFFGFVNDLTSIYYRVEPAVVDFLSTVNMLSRSAFGLVLAMAGERLNFRMLTLITTSTVVSGDLLIAAGVSSRRNLAISFMGQIMNGLGATMALTVTQMAPSNWFPPNERGRSVSIPWITRRLSPVISNLVATRTIRVPTMLSEVNATNGGSREQQLVNGFRESFQLSYLCVALVAVLAYVFSYKFVTDYPRQLNNIEDSPVQPRPWNPCEEFRGILKVFSHRQYVLLFIMYVLVLSVRPLTEWLVSSVVLSGFPELSDRTAGVMFVVGYTLGSLGPPTGGAILDRFDHPKLTFAIGAALVVGFSALSSFAYHIHNFPLLFFAYIGTTFFRDFSFVCISHSFVEIMSTYGNSMKVRAFSISGSVPWFSLVGYSAVMRIVLDRYGAKWTVLIPIPFYLLGIVLYLCLYRPPKHKPLL